jgi:hypothetical protein
MAVPFIFRLSGYSYLVSSLVNPHEILDSTATFLSYLIIPPATDPITHIFKCLMLLVSFVVLYTVLGGKAIYSLFIQPGFSAASKSKPANTMQSSKKAISAVIVDLSPCTEQSTKEKQITPTMQSAADIVLPTITKEQDLKTIEPTPITIEANSQASPIVSPTASPTSSTSTDQLIKDLLQVKSSIPPTPAVLSKDNDQLTKELVSSIINEPRVTLITAEPLTPRPETTVDSSTAVDHDIVSSIIKHDNASDSSNTEHYYSEIIDKTNNLSTLSDNLQRIFDAPLTPSPDNHNRPVSPVTAIQPSKSSSIEQRTPALTPPNNPSSAAGSTLSRKSSTASHQSFSQFKSRFTQRPSGPRQSEKQLEKQPMQAQQNQQITNDSAIDTTSIKMKKRFSTLLGRKKSMTKAEEPVVVAEEQALPPVNLKPKRSVSSKLQKGIKKTGKRFSSIFSK